MCGLGTSGNQRSANVDLRGCTLVTIGLQKNTSSPSRNTVSSRNTSHKRSKGFSHTMISLLSDRKSKEGHLDCCSGVDPSISHYIVAKTAELAGGAAPRSAGGLWHLLSLHQVLDFLRNTLYLFLQCSGNRHYLSFA